MIATEKDIRRVFDKLERHIGVTLDAEDAYGLVRECLLNGLWAEGVVDSMIRKAETRRKESGKGVEKQLPGRSEPSGYQKRLLAAIADGVHWIRDEYGISQLYPSPQAVFEELEAPLVGTPPDDFEKSFEEALEEGINSDDEKRGWAALRSLGKSEIIRKIRPHVDQLAARTGFSHRDLFALILSAREPTLPTWCVSEVTSRFPDGPMVRWKIVINKECPTTRDFNSIRKTLNEHRTTTLSTAAQQVFEVIEELGGMPVENTEAFFRKVRDRLEKRGVFYEGITGVKNIYYRWKDIYVYQKKNKKR